MQRQPGQMVCNDKYRLLALIGEGAYGEVWLVEELTSQSQKALKIARRDNNEARQRFAHERLLSSRLDHPNLVATHTVDKDGDAFYMAMPYMAGGSLAQKLQSGPLPLLEAVQIAAQVAAGLGHLHQRDWVHRDVHPGNILFNGEGVARLSDFGLVQTADTSTSLWYGTWLERHPGHIYYQPPEAIGTPERPLAPLYPASDVYMLGVVLWEMVTGKSYYQHDRTPLLDLRPETPDWLVELLDQCLAIEARQRPFDGASLAQLLTMGVAQLAQMNAEQAAQIQQRQQARAQQTLIQKTQEAITQQDWTLAAQCVDKLQAQGNHTNLAVTLLQKQIQDGQEKQQQQKLNQLVSHVQAYLADDPNSSLAYIAQIEAYFPEYVELPRLKYAAEQEVIKQVTGISPIPDFSLRSWITLLWWLLETPQAYQDYLDSYGQYSLQWAGAWLISSLFHLSLLLLLLWWGAVGRLLPPENGLFPLVTHWEWLILGISGSWALSGAFPDSTSIGVWGVAIVITIVVIGGGVAVGIVIGSVNAIVVIITISVALAFVVVFVAPIGKNISVGVAYVFGGTLGVASGIAGTASGIVGTVTGSILVIVASIVALIIGGLTFISIENHVAYEIKNGRSSKWALFLLIAAYAVMLWQTIAAWLG